MNEKNKLTVVRLATNFLSFDSIQDRVCCLKFRFKIYPYVGSRNFKHWVAKNWNFGDTVLRFFYKHCLYSRKTNTKRKMENKHKILQMWSTKRAAVQGNITTVSTNKLNKRKAEVPAKHVTNKHSKYKIVNTACMHLEHSAKSHPIIIVNIVSIRLLLNRTV